MTMYGVTGPTELRGIHKRRVISALESLDLTPDDRIVSGCAYGVDSVCATWGVDNGIPVTLTAPVGKWHNEQLRKSGHVDVVPVMGGYMARNDETIKHSDVLLAFPEKSIEEQRSGTWATVRRARKAGIPIRYFPLDNSIKLCPWALPTNTRNEAHAGLMCYLECDHEGRHEVHISARRSVWFYEVDERRRILIEVMHARTDGPLDRAEACAMRAIMQLAWARTK